MFLEEFENLNEEHPVYASDKKLLFDQPCAGKKGFQQETVLDLDKLKRLDKSKRTLVMKTFEQSSKIRTKNMLERAQIKKRLMDERKDVSFRLLNFE